jgi:hypothetical protein
MAPVSSKVATAVDEDMSKALEHEGPIPNEDSFAFQESVNDMVDEILAERQETIPPLPELLGDADAIEKAIANTSGQDVVTKQTSKKSKGKGKAKVSDPDITPTATRKPIFNPEGSSGRTQDSDPLEGDYQESFTSQQETAEIRGEIEMFSGRLMSMEAVLEGLVNERKNLPKHLERLQISLNQQFTVMNERLNAAIESGTIGNTLSQTSQDAGNMAQSASTVIDAIQTDLSSPPSGSSQISQPAVITGGRKKVRLVR